MYQSNKSNKFCLFQKEPRILFLTFTKIFSHSTNALTPHRITCSSSLIQKLLRSPCRPPRCSSSSCTLREPRDREATLALRCPPPPLLARGLSASAPQRIRQCSRARRRCKTRSVSNAADTAIPGAGKHVKSRGGTLQA